MELGADGGLAVDLRMPRYGDVISPFREFVEALYLRALRDEDVASCVALAAHELLENAVKYSIDGDVVVRLRLECEGDGATVTVRIRNRADAAQIATLEETFAALAAAPDRMTAYLDAMRRTATDAAHSRLGLARILAETDMELEHRVEDGYVEIDGRLRITDGGAA